MCVSLVISNPAVKMLAKDKLTIPIGELVVKTENLLFYLAGFLGSQSGTDSTCSRILRLRRNTHWHKDASFDSLLSRAGLWHLGKGWIVRGTTTRRLPYGANGLFYPVDSNNVYLFMLSHNLNLYLGWFCFFAFFTNFQKHEMKLM